MIKIALVDDHIVLRKSLSVLIQMHSGYEIVLQAENGKDFIDQLQHSKILPDIVLLDITMPVMSGVETAAWLKANHPDIRILTLSMIRSDQIIIRMLKNGARGYVLKDCEPGELYEALHQIHTNGYYYNELVTPKLRNREQNNGLAEIALSDQEVCFLRWVCTEKTYKEIAAEMKVSHRTVDGYRDSLFRKLQVSSRVGIAMYAIKSHLVQI
ncbi:MAG: response regulator transcription factor [Chitinophagaceae bacterium]|nr:response regulator transcription factor [Chitinophagaceae bacterium]